jgi:glycosyltransferase involved in cell wall biosynthesis
MNVTVASFSKFHVFDLALQLQKRGYLKQFIVNFPKLYVAHYGISSAVTKSLFYTGILHRFYKMTRWNALVPHLHNVFSRQVAENMDVESDIFIGLSSFALEGIREAKRKGMISIVDHGSSHMMWANEVYKREYERFQIRNTKEIAPWLIEKENKEFTESDYVFVCSQHAKNTFIRQGYDSDKIIVNNLGVDLKAFYKIKKDDNIFRIIFCGGIRVTKGVHYLIKAFNEAALPNAELWLIGGGYPNKEIDIVVKRMNLNFHNVHVKGPCPQGGLYKLFSQGSVFCLPSLDDGFGMVVPQALACGLPVIVTENTGAKDIVRDGENGFIVPVCDSQAISEKLIYCYENEQDFRNMKLNALESVGAHQLSWDAYGVRLIGHLNEILQKHG